MDIYQNKRIEVLDPGHSYNLDNLDGGTQRLDFIKKELSQKQPPEGGVLETVQNGTTNEAVLAVLIDRMRFLNEKLPSRQGSIAITKLEEALMWLEHRTRERLQRRVEGTNKS